MKIIIISLLINFASFSALADQNNKGFGYIGGHIGITGGFSDTYGQLNGNFLDSNWETDENPISYGGEGVYLFTQDNEGWGVGISASYTTFTFEIKVSGEQMDATYGLFGYGVLLGKVTSSSEGARSAFYVGVEIGSMSASMECSFGCSNYSDFEDASGYNITIGILGTNNDSPLAYGVGAKYYLGGESGDDGFYELFLTVGVAF